MRKPRDITVQQRRMFLLYNKLGSYGKVAKLLGTSKQHVHQLVKAYHKALAARQEYKKYIKKYKPEKNPKTGCLNVKREAPTKANPETHYFSKQWRSEEGRKQQLKYCSQAGKTAGRKGVANGYSKDVMDVLRHNAKLRAKRMIEKEMPKQELVEKFDVNEEYARQALETAAEIMMTPGSDADRLKATKVVLEFTKSKPVARSEVAVHRAEDFLLSLVEDDD